MNFAMVALDISACKEIFERMRLAQAKRISSAIYNLCNLSKETLVCLTLEDVQEALGDRYLAIYWRKENNEL